LKYFNKFSNEHSSGTALTIYRESSGEGNELSAFGIIASFAHNVQIQKAHFLSLGLQSGFINRHIGNDFRWGSQYEEGFGYNKEIIPSLGDITNLNKNFANFNAGIVWFYNASYLQSYMQRFRFDGFLGASVYNVNRPNQSFFDNIEARLPVNYKVHGGLKCNFTPQFSLFPNLLYVRQNNNQQINIGTYASVGDNTSGPRKKGDYSINIILGLWYRVGDSFIVSAGSQFNNFKFAVSYDFNTSSFEYNNRGKGTMEVSLKYNFIRKKENIIRGLIYPSF